MMFDFRASPFAGQDIRTLLRAQAAARRDKTFLIWAPFEGGEQRAGRSASSSRVRSASRRDCGGTGVGPGDRVLIHLENCPQALFAWFGCGIFGATAVTTNARSSADELAYFAGRSRAVGAITQPKFRALLSDAAPGLSFAVVTDTDCGDQPAAPPAPSERFRRLDADPARHCHINLGRAV